MWLRGAELDVGGPSAAVSLDRATQTYAFTVREGSAGPWRATCQAAFRHDGVVVAIGTLALHERAALDCTLTPPSGHAWRLGVRAERDRPPQGWLVRGEDSLAVHGRDRFAGSVPTRGLLAGYVVQVLDAPVAAVELLNAGAVWLDAPPDASYRRALGAAAAALLLHEDLRAAMEPAVGG